MVEQPAQLLGGELGDAVDVARLERRERPRRSRSPRPAPPARPSRIFCEIISEVVEVKTKRSTFDPGATASSRRLSVPCTLTATNSELSWVSICGLWRAAGMDDGLDAHARAACAAPARGRPPSRRSPWSGPDRGRARRPGGRRAQAAAPGSGPASPTSPSPGYSSPIRPPLLPLQRRPAHRPWRRGCAPCRRGHRGVGRAISDRCRRATSCRPRPARPAP